MLDENIWLQLNEEEKIIELIYSIDQIIAIEENNHELSGTRQQGKLSHVKKDLRDKIFKIIEIENLK
jgi:hypothetical protein